MFELIKNYVCIDFDSVLETDENNNEYFVDCHNSGELELSIPSELYDDGKKVEKRGESCEEFEVIASENRLGNIPLFMTSIQEEIDLNQNDKREANAGGINEKEPVTSLTIDDDAFSHSVTDTAHDQNEKENCALLKNKCETDTEEDVKIDQYSLSPVENDSTLQKDNSVMSDKNHNFVISYKSEQDCHRTEHAYTKKDDLSKNSESSATASTTRGSSSSGERYPSTVSHMSVGEDTKAKAGFHLLGRNLFSKRKLSVKMISQMDDDETSSTKHNGWKVASPLTNKQSHPMFIDSRRFVEICGVGYNSPSDVRIALGNNPSLAYEESKDGKLALHAICSRGLPIRTNTVASLQNRSFNFNSMKTVIHSTDHSILNSELLTSKVRKSPRFSIPRVLNQSSDFSVSNCDATIHSTSSQKNGNLEDSYKLVSQELEHVEKLSSKILRQDAKDLKDVLEIVLETNPGAASIQDNDGNLPVHILARQLWSWKDDVKPRGSFIDRRLEHCFIEVSNIVRKCIEMLLRPLCGGMDNTEKTSPSCRAIGSQGVLLPLHIGALYGVSYDVTRDLLQEYGKAAKVKCTGAIEGVENAFALDLFERRNFFRSDIVRGQLAGFNRLSDFIFSHNPNILPYRQEPDRLARVQKWIRSQFVSKKKTQRNPQALLLWIWMCTFQNAADINDHYAGSIEPILDGIDSLVVHEMTTVNVNGTITPLLDVAFSPCREVLLCYANSPSIRYNLSNII